MVTIYLGSFFYISKPLQEWSTWVWVLPVSPKDAQENKTKTNKQKHTKEKTAGRSEDHWQLQWNSKDLHNNLKENACHYFLWTVKGIFFCVQTVYWRTGFIIADLCTELSNKSFLVLILLRIVSGCGQSQSCKAEHLAMTCHKGLCSIRNSIRFISAFIWFMQNC